MKRSRKPKYTAALAQQLHAQGQTVEQIAAAHGKYPAHVRRDLARKQSGRGRPRKHAADAVRVAVVLPAELHARVKELASAEQISIARWIEDAVRAGAGRSRVKA